MKRDNDGKVKDIRYETALGWNDIKKRDRPYKRTILIRVAECIQSIREIPENF
tara:strand:- start:497 stop:655 length:159 start_codon:yes stop_codon:yes gene_type:complete